MTTKWTHKVVKMARGGDGKWFAFPAAKTFSDEDDAVAYAQEFARHQSEAGVRGARIEVVPRKTSSRDGWHSFAVGEDGAR